MSETRFGITDDACDRGGIATEMADYDQDAPAVVRGDFKRLSASLRRQVGDPREITNGSRGHALTLIWRWSDGTMPYLNEDEENPKHPALHVALME